jgi:hypothetical protein
VDDDAQQLLDLGLERMLFWLTDGLTHGVFKKRRSRPPLARATLRRTASGQ